MWRTPCYSTFDTFCKPIHLPQSEGKCFLLSASLQSGQPPPCDDLLADSPSKCTPANPPSFGSFTLSSVLRDVWGTQMASPPLRADWWLTFTDTACGVPPPFCLNSPNCGTVTISITSLLRWCSSYNQLSQEVQWCHHPRHRWAKTCDLVPSSASSLAVFLALWHTALTLPLPAWTASCLSRPAWQQWAVSSDTTWAIWSV